MLLSLHSQKVTGRVLAWQVPAAPSQPRLVNGRAGLGSPCFSQPAASAQGQGPRRPLQRLILWPRSPAPPLLALALPTLPRELQGGAQGLCAVAQLGSYRQPHCQGPCLQSSEGPSAFSTRVSGMQEPHLSLLSCPRPFSQQGFSLWSPAQVLPGPRKLPQVSPGP